MSDQQDALEMEAKVRVGNGDHVTMTGGSRRNLENYNADAGTRPLDRNHPTFDGSSTRQRGL